MKTPLHVDRELLISQLSSECIADCTRPGVDAAPAVQHWRLALGLTVDRPRAVAFIAGYGAWTQADLDVEPDERLAEKVLWLACLAFAEWDGTADSPCGSDVFVLE